MKTRMFLALALVSLTCTSCLTTLMTVASAPTPVATPVKTTVVTTPVTTVYAPTQTTTTIRTSHGQPTTTVVQVNAVTQDLCLYLDLEAVGAAFAQAQTVQEFEMILNSSRYMISNLDLNRDGYIDYLRVMEVISGYDHVFVIQAVLAANVFQNVATIVVETQYATPYCQIIGEPYLYGTRYVVQPVFVRRPAIYDPICRVGYTPWHSPYYWDYYPSYYQKPAPQYL